MPLFPNMCINIVNIMWEWGIVLGGGDVAETKNLLCQFQDE